MAIKKSFSCRCSYWHRQLILFLAILLVSKLVGQSEVAIALVTEEEHPRYGGIQVSGLDLISFDQEGRNWQQLIKVYPIMEDQEQEQDLPSMLGKVLEEQKNLFFIPRFPFIQGKAYRVVIDPGLWPESSQVKTPLTSTLTIPVLSVPNSVKVLAIYPSTDHFPLNQLKLYIQFSDPMREGNALHHIYVEDENGEKLEAPFLDDHLERWSPDQQRLTLWFDPGRIKSGLIPNQQKGLPLQEGQKYRLVIDKNWPDLNGQSLTEDFEKHFEVIQADREKPTIENWSWEVPEKGTSNPFSLYFKESLDYALLKSAVMIIGSDERPVGGEVHLTEQERTWQFHPQENWSGGNYFLRISTDLEDLAGNNLIRPFDRDISAGELPADLGSFVDIPFTVE